MRTHYFCPKDKDCKIWDVYRSEGLEEKDIGNIAVIKKDEKDGTYSCPAINHTKKVKDDNQLYPGINIECALIEILNNQKKIMDLSGKLK